MLKRVFYTSPLSGISKMFKLIEKGTDFTKFTVDKWSNGDNIYDFPAGLILLSETHYTLIGNGETGRALTRYGDADLYYDDQFLQQNKITSWELWEYICND